MITRADLFDPAVLGTYSVLPRPKGNNGGKAKNRYLSPVCAFDIETTTTDYRGDPVNFMYIWQYQIGEDVTVYGRTWDEFRLFVQQVRGNIPDGVRLVAYVHNLSYEWQYLKSVFVFGPDDVFAVDSRKVVKCIIEDSIELRCSYILTNMGLDSFCRKMNVKHQKLSGNEFNYKKIRYPWTFLTERELEYCLNDVRGLTEAVQAQMNRDGDTLYTIPMTSTGYPRREMKRAMKHYSHERLHDMQPTLEEYQLLKDAFRGGNCHASRYYAGKIISRKEIGARILSADRSSSYPDVLMNCKFPMQKWRRGEASGQNLKNLIQNGYAVMFRAIFKDIQLKNPAWPCPYLTVDKGNAICASVDNGRILSAAEYKTALTDVDFRILLYEYKFSELYVTELYFTDYDYLPAPMRAVISDYYRTKTALKSSSDTFNKLLYDKSKAILNGLYGMCAQDPLKDELRWNGKDFKPAGTDPAEILADHNRKSFLNYAWGVWCTAWARLRLEDGIIIAGADNFIYSDTDSVKYIDRGQDWTYYNEKRKEDSERSGAYAEDSKYTTHYMGVYEADGEYQRFITLGAKRYAYEDMTGDLHITVSGVSKSAAKELGCLENFHDGFIFYHPGKTQSDYIDFPTYKQYVFEDQAIEATSCVIISETTYDLSLSESYRTLLRLIVDGHDY